MWRPTAATFSILCFLSSSCAWSVAPLQLDPGFSIAKVAAQAKSLPSHSWEFGTATETLLELYNLTYSVFGDTPFPVPTLTPSDVPSLAYAQENIVIGTGANGLSDGDGAVGDPASLGVGAVMLGKTNETFAAVANEEIDYILNDAPRFWNDAISQRSDVAELWADFMYMAPPFMAYYAADKGNASLLRETVRQCGLYRQILKSNTTANYTGLWEHIVGPQSADPGLWSTGNAWAAAGMARVLATVIKAPIARDTDWRSFAIADLTSWIREILDGAIAAPHVGGLLRNYLNDTSGDGHGFGEISGSSLLASVSYRMAVLAPDTFGSKYTDWAESIRMTLGGTDADGNPHITSDGIATPAVDPLDWLSTTPYTAGSPEGQNFVVLMYAAWRDWKTSDGASDSVRSSVRSLPFGGYHDK
ncbi:hypothetical protein FISHEDRAFT_65632 [Fistulina hepatica ATCC 64428]|uniref:Six-hairpin glycosidase n=1 Tax=Fistulina hepatica ATCC 64428 TaxID=1128425 RepID=A0A0D7ACX1_9AGAR|nr:hypothetical protein FISHEDRAFT_65632 [Fistulina hepatica ATCC 64428]